MLEQIGAGFQMQQIFGGAGGQVSQGLAPFQGRGLGSG
jgi:hypothetical protein